MTAIKNKYLYKEVMNAISEYESVGINNCDVKTKTLLDIVFTCEEYIKERKVTKLQLDFYISNAKTLNAKNRKILSSEINKFEGIIIGIVIALFYLRQEDSFADDEKNLLCYNQLFARKIYRNIIEYYYDKGYISTSFRTSAQNAMGNVLKQIEKNFDKRMLYASLHR